MYKLQYKNPILLIYTLQLICYLYGIKKPIPTVKLLLKLVVLLFALKAPAQVTLSHNTGDNVLHDGGSIYSCSGGNVSWARAFTLQDFGVQPNEDFVIYNCRVGINPRWINWGSYLKVNIYAIDNGFPATFNEANLIGSSQEVDLWPTTPPDYYTLTFDTPVTIPAGTTRILVEGHQPYAVNTSAALFCSGTAQDNDISWFKASCGYSDYTVNTYVNTVDIGYPNARFYIVVNGYTVPIGPYSIQSPPNCADNTVAFNLNGTNAASATWDFNDPGSGAANTSNALAPTHTFTAPGNYTVSAVVTATDGQQYPVRKMVTITPPPVANAVTNLLACEDIPGTGISSAFDTSAVQQQLVNGQTGKVVTYYDASGNTLPSPLPNPMTNTTAGTQTIRARVANTGNAACFDETTFTLTTTVKPTVNNVQPYHACDDDNDGYAPFNLGNLVASAIGNQLNIQVAVFDSNNVRLPLPLSTSYTNKNLNTDTVKIRVSNASGTCTEETTVQLIVDPTPIAHPVIALLGCDDNNDGISAAFDTSVVEQTVLGSQTGMVVTYKDASGNSLPSPLPNPFTNTTPNMQTITIRVTNPLTGCYKETPLVLNTSNKPAVTIIGDVYACDEGNGFGTFDFADIEQQILGTLTGVSLSFTLPDNSTLVHPLPATYRNAVPYAERIKVHAVQTANTNCFTDFEFNLRTSAIPVISLSDDYTICGSDPSIHLTENSSYDSWIWKDASGNTLSSAYQADIINEGQYTLTVTDTQNGIVCDNTTTFTVIRTALPHINDVEVKDFSTNNTITVIATGDGTLEYALNNGSYARNDTFTNLEPGVYTVHVRDREGCGYDNKIVTVLDYPRYFSPNGDNVNDYWQIKNLWNYPNAEVIIYDRYGKLITMLKNNDKGWDGTYEGSLLPATDYWFEARINNRSIKGHFSLVR